MDTAQLFLRTLDDLETKISSTDGYEILQASALIRKLFLDGNRLVDQVNRLHGLKIKFEVVDTQKLLGIFSQAGVPALEFLAIGDALDPDVLPNPPRKVVSRDTFFATKVQLSRGQELTIQDIILYQANVAGGVHLSDPRTIQEQTIALNEDSITILGLAPGLQQLKAIGRVILKALTPLRVVVMTSQAIVVDSHSVEAHYNRGVVYATAGKLAEAISDFDTAIAYGSEHPLIRDAYYNRGRTRYQLAMESAQSAEGYDPNAPPSNATVEQLRQALSDFEVFVARAPESPDREVIEQTVAQMRAWIEDGS